MNQSSIVFKGTKDGLTIIVDEMMSLEDLKLKLEAKTASLKNFLKGSKLFIKFNRNFNDNELTQLVDIIERTGDVEVIMVAPDTDISGSIMNSKNILQDANSSNTKFFAGTLRSGKSISFDGNVVILGDVNPGAEVIANGNVIVLGNLRGMVHAGVPNNTGCYIFALLLQPTQLRIGDIISRPPDNEKSKSSKPEIAVVNNELIMIESIDTYNNKNGKL